MGFLVNWRKYPSRWARVSSGNGVQTSDWAREAFENTKDWKNLPPELSLLLRYIEGADGKDGFDAFLNCVARQKTKVVVMVKGGQHELRGRYEWHFLKGE